MMLGYVSWTDRFFFFQAEDGIRDYKVTGVQTCALPISAASVGCRPVYRKPDHSFGRPRTHATSRLGARTDPPPARAWNPRSSFSCGPEEIGRASCRERV